MKIRTNFSCVRCGAQANTECDKCEQPTCRSCSQIVVKKPTDVVVHVYHKGKCTPKKFRKE